MLSRRQFLRAATASACSAAAIPGVATATFAEAPGENRLVVIILRGAMDGLDVVRPLADPLLRQYRPGFQLGPDNGAQDLDGFFALHPGLSALMPLWRAGELGFAQAVSTPYRDGRSHFDGQDLLEAGTAPDPAGGGVRDGWLNRLLQVIGPVSARTAFSIGLDQMLVLQGTAEVTSWAPASRLAISPQARHLIEMVHQEDPLFSQAMAQAIELGDDMPDAKPADNRRPNGLAKYAVERLNAETRIAAFSLPGWDTHRNQKALISRPLSALSDVILTLKSGLGANWSRTSVLAMTEFGRTARQNGSGGTDHGTGGAMLFAGGAVRGGRVLGQWPGLAESDLYDGRDLMPTSDVRAYAGWAMRGLFGVDQATLESAVFPGLDLAADPGLIL